MLHCFLSNLLDINLIICYFLVIRKESLEPNLTVTVMETTVPKLAAVCASLAGGEPTAPNPTVPVIV